MELITDLIGYVLLLTAVDFKRKPESEIKAWGRDWYIVLAIIVTGVFLIEFK